MPGAGEVIWYRDVKSFLKDANLVKFVPDVSMGRAEQLNAALRFSIYASVILAIAKRSIQPLFFAFAVAALTWGMNESHSQSERAREGMLSERSMGMEPHTGRLCVKPTMHNPFMNVLSSDSVTRPKRPAACNIGISKVQKDMERNFAHNLYRDADDPLDRSTSSRQFYTMPVTTIPGDQTAFAKWLYATGKTCKEGNGARCSALLPKHYMR